MIWLHGLITLTITLSFLGCAETQQTRSVGQSGFLRDHYYLLHEGAEGEALLIYKNPNVNWTAYHKVMVDPVTIWLGNDSKLKEVSPEIRQRLANDLWAKVVEALADDYESVHHPEPGVMRVQVAITEAEASNPALDTVSSVVPQLRLLTGAKGVIAGGKPGFAGQASIAGKITDAQTGELLLAAVDQRAGTKSVSGATYSWNDVELAYTYWAHKLRYRLCQERGGTNCVEPKE